MARTVTTPPRLNSNPSMSLVGYLLAGGVALLLLPLLPFLAVAWVIHRVMGRGRADRPRRGAEPPRTT